MSHHSDQAAPKSIRLGMALPKKVWNREKTEYGSPTGGTRKCRMEGCLGMCIAVRWPDGSLTWPCTRGMSTLTQDEMKIG
jgi:hypothetical protein